MWESLNLKFSKYPARMAVAQKMFELGDSFILELQRSHDGTKLYKDIAKNGYLDLG